MSRHSIYGFDAVEAVHASGEVELYRFEEKPTKPGSRRWALYKPGGEYHCVTLGGTSGRWDCTCNDWLYRGRWKPDADDANCKHIRAVKAELEPPAPEPTTDMTGVDMMGRKV